MPGSRVQAWACGDLRTSLRTQPCPGPWSSATFSQEGGCPQGSRDMKCFGHCPDTHSWSRAGSREQEVSTAHATCRWATASARGRESVNKYSRHLSVQRSGRRNRAPRCTGCSSDLQADAAVGGKRRLSGPGAGPPATGGFGLSHVKAGSVLLGPGPQKLKTSSCSGPLLSGLSQSAGERLWAYRMSCTDSPVSRT